MPKVTNFSIGVVTYFPGDIVEILDSQFSPGFMEKMDVVTVQIEVVALPVYTKDLKISEEMAEKVVEQLPATSEYPAKQEEKPKPRRVTS